MYPSDILGADNLIANMGEEITITTHSTPVYTKAVPIKSFRRVTQDQLEYVRELRIPKSTIKDYGSLVDYEDKSFYIIGIDDSDLSTRIRIRETNGTVSVYRIGKSVFNGFSYDATPVSLYSDIPAYIEYINSDMRLASSIGYVPTLISFVIIPEEYDVRLNDRIIIGSDTLRVNGIDRSRVQNMLTFRVDYDLNRA